MRSSRPTARSRSSRSARRSSSLIGCPDCPFGRDARDLVFSDGFWINASYTILPFIIVLLVVRAIVRRIDKEDGNASSRDA
jgi:hypothetical protein